MTYSSADLPQVAAALLRDYGPTRVFALVGELGAGKTTLVAELCRQLGVTEPTSSPTFSIVNQYRGANGTVYHLDCYRLESLQEALDTGLEDIFEQTESPVFVEWPAVIEALLPEDTVILRLRHVEGGTSREMEVVD